MKHEVINKEKKTLYIILYNGSEGDLHFLNMAHLICSSENAPTDNRELTVKNLFLNDSLKSSCTFLMTNPLIIISINRLLTYIPGTTGSRKKPKWEAPEIYRSDYKEPKFQAELEKASKLAWTRMEFLHTHQECLMVSVLHIMITEFVEVALNLHGLS